MFLNLARFLPATRKPQGFADETLGCSEPCSPGQVSRPDLAQLLGTDGIFELEVALMAVDLRKRMPEDHILYDTASWTLYNHMQPVERDRSKAIALYHD